MIKLTWFWQAIFGMLLVVPAWLGITMANRIWNIRGDVALLWYTLGMFFGTAGFILLDKFSIVPTNWRPVWFLVFLGMTIGAGANVLIFRSVVTAPNPGLSTAINSASSVILFLVTALLALVLPKYFSSSGIRFTDFLGILFATIGVILIAVRH